MGKVLVSARLENLEDIYKVAQGALPAEQVRTSEVFDALIDTGATGLLVPRRLIAQLGLSLLRTRSARTIAGNVEEPMYRAVRLTVQGRDCISDVGEIARQPVDPAHPGLEPSQGHRAAYDLSDTEIGVEIAKFVLQHLQLKTEEPL